MRKMSSSNKMRKISSSTVNEIVKQPIRRLEIPISKFNDVAIPHHLDLLRRHKTNVNRYVAIRDWDKVYSEQINATRVVRQLKHLLHEMDTLRSQVLDCDIALFDKLTIKTRKTILKAIQEYLEFELKIPTLEEQLRQAAEKPKNQEGRQENNWFGETNVIEVNMYKDEEVRQEACLAAWADLHSDLQQLQELFIDFNKLVVEQAEAVDRIENTVEETQVNVEEGTKHLQQASRYRIMAYPLAGAFLGTCLGGPVGLLAGMKFGGLTAVGGGLIGYTGGAFLKKKCHLDGGLKQIEGPAELKSMSDSSMESSGSVDKKDL